MSSGTAFASNSPGIPPGPTPVTELSDQDRAVLQHVDQALADALCLKRWWVEKDKKGDYAERFDLVRTFNAPDRGTGFFDVGPTPTGNLPVMGVVQEMCFDQPKHTPQEKVRNELREFVLTYLARVSSFREPEASSVMPRPKPPPDFEFLSWFPENGDSRVGFGYSQLYYKRMDSGRIGKIPERNAFAIFDLREIGQKYEWVVMKVRVFSFNLTFRPFGAQGLTLELPLKEETYLVLSRDFITFQERPLPGVAGRYGFGYALMKYSPDSSIFAYGPGHFRAGFQLINFDVLERGETRVRMVFVVNRPEKILKLNIDPIGWSFKLADTMSMGLASRVFAPFIGALDELPLRVRNFDPVTTYVSLANLLTGGEAARQFGISLEEIEKNMLVQHFMEHYRMVTGSLLTWRQVPNWLDRDAVPEWAITGRGR